MCGWFESVCVCVFFGGRGGTNSDFFPSRKRMGTFWILFFGFSIVNLIDFTIFKEKVAKFFISQN
jgi:hypothetical protein